GDSPPLSSPHSAQPNGDSPPLSSPHFAQPNGGTEGGSFNIWTQTRIGLLSHPLDGHAARGHLAASTYLQMALRPDIYHIVGHTEADHAASADDIIEAVKITRRAIQNSLGAPDMRRAPEVQARKQELVEETRVLLDAIREIAPSGVADPWADPVTLARSVTLGLMDAPQLRNNKFGRGATRTRIVDGKSVAVDESGHPLFEKARLSALKKENQ
ncbi:MAG: methionine synthase, partial [Chloroflexota bacterium]